MSFATWTRHEWTQLRLLRRVSLLLTFAVPFLLLAGAAASERGWLPGERIRTWDARTVLYDAAPLVLAGVWSLVAALATGQVFAGGRATGTEWLVLSLPVRRSVVWRARMCAALASTVVVAGASLAFLLGFARLATGSFGGSQPGFGWTAGATVGAVAIVLAMLGTAAVGPFLRQPFQAALAGMVLGVAPLGVASWLGSAFPLATTRGGVSAALAAIVPVFPALLYLSYLVSTRGEPAGRGRLARALVVVAVTIALAVGIFVGVVAASVRLGRQLEQASIVPAPSGDRAVGWSGPHGMTATLYDTTTGEPISLLARSTSQMGAWSADGGRFAMIEDVTMFGRQTVPRLTVWRGSDGTVVERTGLRDFTDYTWGGSLWCGDRFVIDEWSIGPRVLRDGAVVAFLPPPGDGEHVSVVGCTVDDRLVIARGASLAKRDRGPNGSPDEEEPRPPDTELVRVSLDGREQPWVEPVRVAFAPWRSRGRMSPDGRFLLVQAREFGATHIEILDLQEGAREIIDDVDIVRWGWLADGRFVWTEHRRSDIPLSVRMWRPGQEPGAIAIDAPEATVAAIEVSPDARRLLVRASHREGDSFVTDRLAILDPATGRWTELPGPGTPDGEPWSWGWWASTNSIVLEAPDRRGRLVQVDP